MKFRYTVKFYKLLCISIIGAAVLVSGCQRKGNDVGRSVPGSGILPAVTLLAATPTAGAEEFKPPETWPSPVPTIGAPPYIEGSVYWRKKDSPYIVNQDLIIAYNSSLMLEPGVEVRIAPGKKIFVFGQLFAVGSARKEQDTREVVFTSLQETPGAGDWSGIVAESTGSVILSYCRVEYAEKIICNKSSIQIYHTEFTHFSNSCIYWRDAFGDFLDVTFEDINGYPLEISDISSMPSLNAVTVSGTTKPAIVIGGGEIGSDVVLSGMGLPYIFNRGTIKVVKNGNFEIQHAVELRFGRGLGITVQSGGRIKSMGTESRPVLLASTEVNPFPGDWGGIRIEPEARAEFRWTRIENCFGLHISGAECALNQCTFENIEGAAIIWEDSSGTLSDILFNRIVGYPVQINPPLQFPGMERLRGDQTVSPGIFINIDVISEPVIFAKLELPYTFPSVPVMLNKNASVTFSAGAVILFQNGGGFVVSDGARLACEGTAGDQVFFGPEGILQGTTASRFRMGFGQGSELAAKHTRFVQGNQLSFQDASINVSDCSFESMNGDALYLRNTNGNIQNTQFLHNTGYPVIIQTGMEMPGLSDLKGFGNKVDAVYLMASRVLTDMTLKNAGMPYSIGPGILQMDNATLQIMPLNILYFEEASGITCVRNASLIINGSAAQPVLLTTASSPGFWQGIDSRNSRIVMENCHVERAHRAHFTDSHLTVSRSSFKNMEQDGMVLSNSTGTISNVLFQNNPGIPLIYNVDGNFPDLSGINARSNLLNMVLVKGRNLLSTDLKLPVISIPYILQSNLVNDNQTMLITKQSEVAGYVEYMSNDSSVSAYFSGSTR